MSSIDIIIFQWLNSWASWSPVIMRVVSLRAWLLPWVFVAGLAAFVFVPLIFRKYRTYVKKNASIIIYSLVSVGIARFVIVELLRLLIERPRPFEVLDGVTRLIPYVSDGSFPSGHAAAFFALATPMVFYYRKTASLFLFAALVISVDRIIGGVHWPSDVIAGAAVGIGTAWLVRRCFNTYRAENK